MRKTLLALTFIAIASPSGLFAQQTKTTPDLEAIMADSAPSRQIRVIASMSARYAFRPFSVSVPEQREQIRLRRVEELKEFASSDQAGVSGYLSKAAAGQKASDVRSNRIKNQIAFSATADVIKDLARRDDIALIFPYDEVKFAEENVTDAELNIIDYTRDFDAAFSRLSDANPTARRNAILFIARQQTPESLKAIIGVLYDDDVLVRRTAVEALGRLEGAWPSARAAVAEFLKKETDVGAKISAIRAAGDLGGTSSVETLKKLAVDPYAIYRSEAVKALGKISPQGISSVVVPAISDEAEGVRIAAMEVAGRLRIAAGLPGIRANLSDPSTIVRRAAAWALGQTGGTSDADTLIKMTTSDPEDYVRVEAANSVELIRSRIKSQAK
ncbi:MAG: hypothetical protein CVU77_02100 [Elusimicrobia bacterium HGW-Elusimicrobia-1]|jgi:hypothetical protein|nr:MAG: hypothetical protein CVU77_02100 [Elusimicrobia bacterium HGW-Elusimicrobia-1]